MKQNLKDHILEVMKEEKEEIECLDKHEAILYGFEQGYKYRKTLELALAYRYDPLLVTKIPVTSEVNPRIFKTDYPFSNNVKPVPPNPDLTELDKLIIEQMKFFGKAAKKQREDIFINAVKETCPTCLNNQFVEKAFTANEISMKLYDAKFRSIIDQDQLFKLLDYFEKKAIDEDDN